MPKTLMLICGANGIGKTTISRQLLRRIRNSAYIDSEFCRAMNPSVLDDTTIPTITRNISCLIRNYLLCPAVDTVILSYGFHGRRIEVFHGVLRDLASLEYTFVPLLLVCEESENVRRMRADGRDNDRILRSLEHSRPAYGDVGYPQLDITKLSVDEAVAAVLQYVELRHTRTQ
jgi:Cdc6-like AAA superfamily ATPase